MGVAVSPVWVVGLGASSLLGAVVRRHVVSRLFDCYLVD